jgi:hypothetical protein
MQGWFGIWQPPDIMTAPPTVVWVAIAMLLCTTFMYQLSRFDRKRTEFGAAANDLAMELI